jgi:hypothetical protein
VGLGYREARGDGVGVQGGKGRWGWGTGGQGAMGLGYRFTVYADPATRPKEGVVSVLSEKKSKQS